jgi:two-component system, chemotaxis family, protein-glutamate methylesterase/glutaminase
MGRDTTGRRVDDGAGMVKEPHRVVVIGASAGGVEALTRLVARVDADVDAALLVVMHVPRSGTSLLPRILQRAGMLPAAHPEDGDAIEAGRIYVAPPDRHLVVTDGRVALSIAPRENGHRPAVNPLFRTAARVWGARTVAVVLSGSLDDGAAGVADVRRHGGLVYVQDPGSALQPDMPAAALRVTDADFVGDPGEIGERLRDLPAVSGVAPGGGEEGVDERTMYTCPDCGGVMSQVGGDPITLQCHVGHAWSGDGLLEQQSLEVERAMWVALRTLQERDDLLARMEAHAHDRNLAMSAERFAEERREMGTRAQQLRRALGVEDADGVLPR